jgi:prepilin-type N-terminal cleavage/methylation domain-containing protein
MTHRPHRSQNGFTLIELLVAIGLFAIIMTLAAGAYLIMIHATMQAQAISTGIDNLSFALETMTREIRTGTDYSCGTVLGAGDCSAGLSSMTFKNTYGDTVTYRVSGGSIVRTDTPPSGSPVSASITDPSVDVTQLTFYVFGSQPYALGGDTTQARAEIIVAGQIETAGATEPFNVETGATMRKTDL